MFFSPPVLVRTLYEVVQNPLLSESLFGVLYRFSHLVLRMSPTAAAFARLLVRHPRVGGQVPGGRALVRAQREADFPEVSAGHVFLAMAMGSWDLQVWSRRKPLRFYLTF